MVRPRGAVGLGFCFPFILVFFLKEFIFHVQLTELTVTEMLL